MLFVYVDLVYHLCQKGVLMIIIEILKKKAMMNRLNKEYPM